MTKPKKVGIAPTMPDAFAALELKHEKIIPNSKNALIIVQHELPEKLGFNQLSDRFVFVGDLPWRKCRDSLTGMPWDDNDTLHLINYIHEYYDTVFIEKIIDFTVRQTAVKNEFDPLRRYLDSLPRWDGKPRIATVLHDFLGVEINPYTTQVSALLFRAMVARAYRPGCKFDYMLVLQGNQGIGKSSFLSVIGGDWYSDGLRKFEGKEGMEALQGVWLAEIPELQGFSKTDVGAIKAFITRTNDRCRAAYGRNVRDYLRRAVLVGTTNDDNYLRDTTGNRRFLPVVCTRQLDRAALKAALPQVFAEAVALYAKNPDAPLTIEGSEAERLAEVARQTAEYIDPWQHTIAAWLEELIPEDYWESRKPLAEYDVDSRKVRRDRVSTREIFEECLKIPTEKRSNYAAKRIADIMRRLGWKQKTIKFGKRYGTAKGYSHPESMLSYK